MDVSGFCFCRCNTLQELLSLLNPPKNSHSTQRHIHMMSIKYIKHWRTHTSVLPVLKQFIEASLQGHSVWNRNCYLIWLQVLSPLYWRATIIHLLPTCITQHRGTSLYWQMVLVCLHLSGLKSCIKLYKKSIEVTTPVYSVTILIAIYIGIYSILSSVRQRGTTMTLQLCSCRSGKKLPWQIDLWI